ncbi:MAG: hypothetical protein FK733_16380 [Asgard group archaeon]|nr:hypothetical protein [Asgard group archaeon]
MRVLKTKLFLLILLSNLCFFPIMINGIEYTDDYYFNKTNSVSIVENWNYISSNSDVSPVLADPLTVSPILYSTFIGGSNSDSVRDVVLDSSSGALYLIGNTRSADFPTTSGAYDESHNGDNDCFVVKLSADGSLIYSTFVGGSGSEYPYSFAIDNEENAYVTGWTGSSNFPTTSGAYDESFNGGLSDCFVFKLSADGSSLINSTFIGGDDIDYGLSIALDNQGNPVVTGDALSSNFPTTSGVYNESPNGNGDCFVIKLSTDCSTLLNSTFIGGSERDYGISITFDYQGNIYVTGSTHSSNFPITSSTFDGSFNGARDCFVIKLTADCSSLLYSTFVGGSAQEDGMSLAIDCAGDIYVAGYTLSSNFPTTTGAYDESHNGDADGFVFKLTSDGANLSYSTYTGGSGYDFCNSFVLDHEGNVYVSGGTYSSNFPTSPYAYNTSINGGSSDCTFFILSTNGSSLLYSTFIGGTGDDGCNSIILDSSSEVVYLIGYSGSSNFPTTSGALNETYNGGNNDGILMKFVLSDFDHDGLANNWEAYYGTNLYDQDSDSDGILDGEEIHIYRTDPTNDDTDGDGLSDSYEINTSTTDPTDADTDGDGLTDEEEIVTEGTDPLEDDCDADGLTDGEEVLTYLTDPWQADSDGDGLDDQEEVTLGFDGYLTDPWQADSDGDGLSDLDEITFNTDPNNTDTDDDNLSDYNETTYGTDPLDADTDGDGIEDGEEVVLGSDGFITNPTETDTDDDGIDDATEITNGTDPTNPNDPPTETSPLFGSLIGMITFVSLSFAVIILVKRKRKN